MDEDMDDGYVSSGMSEWASEDEPQTLQIPVFKDKADAAEWERKQRNREYRIAARREKRTRKADEKKQRKLNATILRRMTKNPAKYNKNIDRNRLRDIELERKRIYNQAVAQAERLAAVHDPTGKSFNVGPVIVQDDGKVVSVEVFERRQKAINEKLAKAAAEAEGVKTDSEAKAAAEALSLLEGINPARAQLILPVVSTGPRMSNSQRKKVALLEDKAVPPKPVIPDGVSLPEGEEDWISLWHLTDEELERRVLAEKRRKADVRKALRKKQQEGKTERRAARDERRKVYREKKLEWKEIKEEEKKQKRSLLRVEQEERKRVEIEVNAITRQRIMEACSALGFTLQNVKGVKDITPKVLGEKGREINFDEIEIGERPSALKVKGEKAQTTTGTVKRGGRIDLSKATNESHVKQFLSDEGRPGGLDSDFVSLHYKGDNMEEEFGEMNYNHKLRRKLHRAIEAAQVKKEMLVRDTAVADCEAKGIEIPEVLVTRYEPMKLDERRVLADGTVETEKAERVRKRIELAEYNTAAKVLRMQAKATAMEAGLRLHAKLTGVVKDEQEAEVSVHPEDSEASSSSSSSESVKAIVKVEKVDKQESKKRQRDDVEDEPQPKKNKKAKKSDGSSKAVSEVSESAAKVKKSKKSKSTPVEDSEATENAATSEPVTAEAKSSRRDGETAEERTARKEKNRAKKLMKQQNGVDDAEDVEMAEEPVVERSEKKSKKSKKTKQESKEDTPVDSALLQQLNEEASPEKYKKIKKTKKHQEPEVEEAASDLTKKKSKKNKAEDTDGTNGAEQWNPDALGGDDARKQKFLRLLGAGKVNGTEKPAKGKVSKKAADIAMVENELERQFDAGIRMKHDGQGKRRGLGA